MHETKWISVVVIMLAAGIVGGTVNFALSRTKKSTRQDWVWAVVIGIGASFLMPLFLSTLSSNLLKDFLEEKSDLSAPFVFAGFCLLGAIASRAMIQSLTEKVLKEAEAARQEVSDLEDAMAPILEKETEQDEDTEIPREQRAELSNEQKDILRALDHPRFSLRSVSGIVKQVERDREPTIADLDKLAELELASQVQGKKGVRWAITPSGRRLLISQQK